MAGAGATRSSFHLTYAPQMPDLHLTVPICSVNLLFSLSSWLNQEAASLFEHLLCRLRVSLHAANLHCGFGCRLRGIRLNEKDCVPLYLVKLSHLSPYVNQTLCNSLPLSGERMYLSNHLNYYNHCRDGNAWISALTLWNFQGPGSTLR